MSTPNQRDLVIIGGGPAGYSAALYAARASLDTLVVEQGMPGGQIATSDMLKVFGIGVILICLAVIVASYTVIRLQPKDILTKME